MKALDHQKISLVLLLLKKTQNFVWGYSIMLIMVILIVNGKEKSLNLNPTIKMLIFQLNFVSEVFLMDLVLLSLEKCL